MNFQYKFILTRHLKKIQTHFTNIKTKLVNLDTFKKI